MTLLFDRIDEPGLNTLEVYESRGGYQSLRKALEMTPEGVLKELEASGLRGRGGAGFAMGKKVSFLPHGSIEKYLVCNADESEPGTFKDRELMQKTPHMLIEGLIIASYAGDITRSFIYIRGEYDRRRPTSSTRRSPKAYEAGYLGERIPRFEHSLARGAPRRRCLHLRRGDRPVRLAGRQARQPTVEAPVPRQPGPLSGADADQQRRDALHHGSGDRPHGRRRVRQARHRDLDRHEARVDLRPRPAARQLRDRARHPLARDRLRPRRRPAGGARGQVLVPGRLLGAGAHRRGPGRALRLRLARQGRLDARLGRDHRGRRLHADPRRGDEGREVLPPRVLRQVHALPRGHQLDGEDARADRLRRGDADGPRDHGLGPGAHHRQLPVRARRRDGDADRLDDREVPRVRGPHRGAGPATRGLAGRAAARREGAGRPQRGRPMPRPEQRTITFTIDGREVRRPRTRCWSTPPSTATSRSRSSATSPSWASRSGACRMCLVEIEGIPKLQTGCSTPVKDGMVVNTQTERVKDAQRSVVEFLLINHPLDCPVCDKGGECPLQDITFGWGPGISRFIEPKRHFVKPLELSPTIAIDRERCILCYRCVRFSQEISEDHQLVLLERGAHSYVATFDGHPYVAPFSGNIVELCPVGALTSRPYRFRARPWDIEDAGSVCTLCPSQCNVTLTVRDERVMRVSPARRGGRRLAVRPRPLRLSGARGSGARDRAVDPRRRRAASRVLGARAGGGRAGSATRGRAHGRAGGRRSHERGGVPARAPDPRRPGFAARRLAPCGHPAAGADTRPERSARAGSRERSRVRARRARARSRSDRRRPDPRPAPAQGHPPPRRAARAGRRGPA